MAATLPQSQVGLPQISRLLGQQMALILTHREIQLTPKIYSFVGTGLLDPVLHSGKDRLGFNYRFEGIAKARENGVKFGRPAKVTDSIKQDIYSRRLAGATIGQLAKEFSLGEATIYRALNTVKQADEPPSKKSTKVILWLQVENNSKFVRGKGKSRQNIEDYCLSEYGAKKLEKDGWEYERKQ